ncbi:MAG: NUDIX domain-containing protein [Acidimicrobiales bacterium]|jgi:8-oxo-dGTP diphosphatase
MSDVQPPCDGEERPGGHFRHEVLAVVFQVRQDVLHVLLWQRAQSPFRGRWALPGGPLGADERLGASLGRHLATKVDLRNVAYLEQLETRSDVDRDPREREIATAYLVLVATDLNPDLPSDTTWLAVEDLPPTAFDHASIIESGRERLRAKLTYTNAGYAMAPETFTITELRTIYAACIGHAISATNLQRVLLRRQIIQPTGVTSHSTPTGGRPATLYRFSERVLHVTNPFAVFKPPVDQPALKGRSPEGPNSDVVTGA